MNKGTSVEGWHATSNVLGDTAAKLECNARCVSLASLFGAAMVTISRDIRDRFACVLYDQAASARLEWRVELAKVERRKGEYQ